MNNLSYLNTNSREIIDALVQKEINKQSNSKVINIASGSDVFDKVKSKNEFSPTEIAKELIKLENDRGNHWAYVAEKDKFYFYDNDGYWRSRNMRYLSKLIRRILKLSNSKWDRKNKIREVLSALKDKLIDPLNIKRFDIGFNPNKKLINLENGMLDWRKGELFEHNHEYYSQIQIPIPYNPDAYCSKWKQYMKEWVPEKESRMVLQEYVGYCLIPDTSMQKAMFLTGSGSNGKSTFLEVISSLFGGNILSNIPLQKLQNRFEITEVENKLVNICSDIDSTNLNETGNVKTLISGEKLRGEYKHGASFDFTPVARLFFSANKLPTTSDKSFGWYRRFDIIEFPNQFNKGDSDHDPDLKYKLYNELPGIFNWALEGLKRLKTNKEFTHSKNIDKSKYEYETINDPVKSFINDMCNIGRNEYEIGKEVYSAYKNYCEDYGLKYLSRHKLTSRLKEFSIISDSKYVPSLAKTERCYIGMSLKPAN